MLAIGIDPGTAICGYGVVMLEGNHLTPIKYGAIFTDKDDKPEIRLRIIYEELTLLLDEYKPDIVYLHNYSFHFPFYPMFSSFVFSFS